MLVKGHQKKKVECPRVIRIDSEDSRLKRRLHRTRSRSLEPEPYDARKVADARQRARVPESQSPRVPESQSPRVPERPCYHVTMTISFDFHPYLSLFRGAGKLVLVAGIPTAKKQIRTVQLEA
ncbi:hypothetical protein HYFRA_00003774 [Hymenoscyphus fraxineus]|uniref:Uncharacterized protein n=1 Tax=Hymenoscyphus fraxineus TaxID=746836 RepID=A0A9N9PR16_9HELO|nr:hypothetical protein HYFRA_00003774 [Hymenoscyphus fraxineus]